MPRSVWASLLGLAFFAAGCGDDGEAVGPTAEDDRHQVVDTAEALLEAMRNGDDGACGSMTPDFVKTLDSEGTCAVLMKQMGKYYKADLEEWNQHFGEPVRDVSVDGDTALFIVGDQVDGTVFHLVRTEGSWLLDDQEGVYAYRVGQSTQEDLARWMTAWCGVEKGMTRAEVVEVMGEPSVDDHGEMHWTLGAERAGDVQADFFVIIGDDDVVTDLGSAAAEC